MRGFSVTNFTLLSRNIVTGLEVSASIYNLLNNTYRDPGGEEHLMNAIPQDGIGFRLKATYAF